MQAPPGQYYQPPPQGGVPYRGGPQQSYPTPTEAIIALVLALSTMMTTCFPLGFVALYFGAKARRIGRERGDKNSEVMGLIAMILGGVLGGLWALFWLAQVLMIVLPLGFVGVLGALGELQ